jgi:hypothetical protein
MPADDYLRQVLDEIAVSSEGKLTFTSTTAVAFAKECGLSLSRSTNPLYVFSLTTDIGKTQTFIAFTLSLDGAKRPATRAEALGKSIAETDGKLFELNPFLLVYDYVGQRLLAVSAIELFDAFAQHASTTVIPYSGTSSFSLSPNFEHGTISMYATLGKPVVWKTSSTAEALTFSSLSSFLLQTKRETSDKQANIPEIVRACQERLAALPMSPASVSVSTSALSNIFASLNPNDNSLRVDDRILRMILNAIQSYSGVILVGPPGTGKSALIRKAIGTLSESRQADGMPGLREPLWATPDESWTSRELIGGETVSGSEIVFRPGWVLRAIAEDRWLVLDEANRGDLDRIFGALLTWLSGGTVAVGVESAAQGAKTIELAWTSGSSGVQIIEGSGDEPGKIQYLASEADWKLLGTYNALDAQRVFRLGAALGRRFVRIPIPPVAVGEFKLILEERAADLPETLRNQIALLYEAHYENEVTRVGPALFLGMCPYIRSAQKTYGGIEIESEQHVLGDEETGGDQEVSEDIWNKSGMIIGEAYLLNMGTLLAQLEEPDLNQLAQSIQASGVMSSEEVEWVIRMIRALA